MISNILDHDELREYLDDAIRAWREIRDGTEIEPMDEHTAGCYIDAFQSVRVTVFGEALP